MDDDDVAVDVGAAIDDDDVVVINNDTTGDADTETTGRFVQEVWDCGPSR